LTDILLYIGCQWYLGLVPGGWLARKIAKNLESLGFSVRNWSTMSAIVLPHVSWVGSEAANWRAAEVENWISGSYTGSEPSRGD